MHRAALGLLLAAGAFGQESVKPYILLAFDTSGSMSGAPLAEVKEGASNVVNAFGEVTFGLARFHQEPSAGCEGWWGGCGGGDILVGIVDGNQQEILDWMDGCDNFPSHGACGADSCCGVAGQDACDSCTDSPICTGPGADCGGGCDKELRASGTTPLAGLLARAHDYLTGTIMPADPKVGCRPYAVLLLTDGYQTCFDQGLPAPAAATLAAAGIPVHVIGFGYSSSEADAIAEAGGTGAAVYADDAESLALVMADIIMDSVLVELCNGLDDDCDGLIDEDYPGLGAPCDNGAPGACFATGVTVCAGDALGTTCSAPPVAPGPEVCNGRDDDCDGEVDEGVFPCACYPELCNGNDDDCDGEADDGDPEGGGACGTSTGPCEPGVWHCVDGDLVCEGGVGPAPEECNCVDDDCDGTIDEEVARPCYAFAAGCTLATGECVGACFPGFQSCACVDGYFFFGECLNDQGPRDEACNGMDDDCDGVADDDAACPDGTPCIEGGCALPCDTREEFACPPGFYCEVVEAEGAGARGYCAVDPCAAVACDDGQVCVGGACEPICEFVACAHWQSCSAALPGCADSVSPESCCEDVSCTSPDHPCADGRCCDVVNHACATCACARDTCPEGSCCREPDGACVACCASECPEGRMCRLGQCAADPCAGVTCELGETCKGGACRLDPCLGVRCPANQICAEGTCVVDPCAGLRCPEGAVCGCPGEGDCAPQDYTCHRAARHVRTATITRATGGCGCALAPRRAPGRGTSERALAALLALAGLAGRRPPRKRHRRPRSCV